MKLTLALAALAIGGCGLKLVGGGLPPNGDAEPEAGSPLAEAGGPPETQDGGAEASNASDASDGSVANEALVFARASNQYVEMTTIPIPSDFTLEVWVKLASIGSEMMLVSEDRAGAVPPQTDDQFRLAVTSAGVPYFVMTDDGSNAHGLAVNPVQEPYALSGSGPLPLGRWTHLAVTKSGTAFALFVDGVVAVQVMATGTGDYPRTAGLDFRFGARMGSGGPADYLDGTLDDVRFFSVARTPAEILSDLHAELSGASTRQDLVGYWRFDEGSGQTAHDDRGAHDGTLVRGVSWVRSDAF
jgi:hypothetical protein